MKITTVLFLITFIIGCGKEDRFIYDLAGGKRIEANSVLDAFKEGSILCNQYESSTDSCKLVQELEKVTKEGVVVSILEGNPFVNKLQRTIELRQKGNVLCTNLRESVPTLIGYYTGCLLYTSPSPRDS